LYSYNARKDDGQKQSIQSSVLGGASPAVAQGCRINWAARGSKINNLNKKEVFLRSTIFKLLRQRRGNSIVNFFNFKIFLMGYHCDYSPRAPKTLPMPLRGNGLQAEENHYQLLL